MRKLSIFLFIVFAIVACSSAPRPKTVDGSSREPVNKTAIKEQIGSK
ncbi:MAG: hypothetical protein WAZ30_01350 [Syntrophorhabdus sp.]